MKENSLAFKLLKKRAAQNILHKMGTLFLRTARWFFDRVTMACWNCGTIVGMNSVISRGHMWCWNCYDRHVKPTKIEAMVAKATDGYKEFLTVDHASEPDQTKILRTTKKLGEKRKFRSRDVPACISGSGVDTPFE